ncbi:Uncharacterised protein [Mycobacterium tuberculosis]|uniref:Uncharacterized protein n=1 Tax=Mycobacterium tuberculosis TaxID=1773 RepID=A0A654TVR8_MYCTX|nr:Uncharacterised protein [Mycobacterium tuberculosis]CNV91009.1 Uncharacterised protein [Mycobacterium tuberculosis]COW97407.1 Uncharacterised protein [Mycobacterium tuberculosis]COX67204.1 Uncharacterised protein [Mycobacterium tuberculosis]
MVVRLNGIVVDLPEPAGLTAMERSPRMVSVRIAARDWSPTTMLRSTLKVTFALFPARLTADTAPTLRPET